jgi:ADP-heptose:LPS heptosyltransferase
MTNNIKRVLIIKCGALGDLVYSLSVVDALIFEFGSNIIIDFVSTPSNINLLSEDARINKVFPLRYKKLPLCLSIQKKAIVSASKQNSYDILINLETGKQFKSLVESIYAVEKIGNLFKNITVDKKFLNRGELQKKYLVNIVSSVNLDKAFPKIAIKEFQDIQYKFNLNNRYLVLSPSNSHVNRSGLNHRAWVNNSWIELIERLSNEIQVVIVGDKSESNFFKKLQPYPSNVVNLVGKNNIIELSTVIKNAKCVVCTDSAVGHIAAAVDTSVFVLMGPNDIVVDSPYKSPTNDVNVISLKKECSPCYKTVVMKDCKDNICMSEITVDMVYDKIKLSGLLD